MTHPSAVTTAEARPLDGFESFTSPIDGYPYQVFTIGSGPSVLILHELPGLTTQCLHLARVLAKAGFKVFVPLLFGKPAESAPSLNVARACLAGGYSCLSSDHPGKIASRMRALSARIHSQSPTSPMGVIGMCLSGGLPIALMKDDWVAAPVLSQPALPFAFSEKGYSALGVSASDIRSARTRGVPMLVLRFTEDTISPKQRLAALKAALPGQIVSLQIDSKPADHCDVDPKAHAVLTEQLSDDPDHPTQIALQKVIHFLDKRLRGKNDAPASVAPKYQSCILEEGDDAPL